MKKQTGLSEITASYEAHDAILRTHFKQMALPKGTNIDGGKLLIHDVAGEKVSFKLSVSREEEGNGVDDECLALHASESTIKDQAVYELVDNFNDHADDYSLWKVSRVEQMPGLIPHADTGKSFEKYGPTGESFNPLKM